MCVYTWVLWEGYGDECFPFKFNVRPFKLKITPLELIYIVNSA